MNVVRMVTLGCVYFTTIKTLFLMEKRKMWHRAKLGPSLGLKAEPSGDAPLHDPLLSLPILRRKGSVHLPITPEVARRTPDAHAARAPGA